MAEQRDSPFLTGGHVVLRPHRSSDRDDIVAACRDEQTWTWTTVPHPYESEHADGYLGRATGGGVDAEWPRWAIATTDDDRFAGNLGVILDGEGAAKVGYFVAPWARRRGIGSVALWLACDWAFRDGGCEVVKWDALVGNSPSRRMAEKVGFRIMDGVARRWVVQRGKRADEWLGDLLPDDLVPLASLLR